jgi:hypothetical protein
MFEFFILAFGALVGVFMIASSYCEDSNTETGVCSFFFNLASSNASAPINYLTTYGPGLIFILALVVFIQHHYYND